MKKRIVMLLCTAVLALGLTMAPAMASGGPFYPIKVDEYTYGPLDELRISKVYQLSLSDDPSGIPTEDFERGGRRYYLLDMIKEDEIGVDTQDYTDTITVDSDTNDLSKILKQLEPHREVTTEDGHTGLLALDYTSVKVEAKGYKTNTRSLSATRTYPNLSDADLELIPKTITDGGKTLTLGAVEWSGGENGFYTATASYTGTSSTRSATGYTVTVSYTGQVAKTDCEVVMSAPLKNVIFRRNEVSFFAGQHTSVYSLNYRPTCRLEARQVLIYQCILDLTGENDKYNYSMAVHFYSPFSYILCSAKNYKIASALTT